MPIVQPLKVLDIDGQKTLVEDMSAEVQQLVAVFNEWSQDAADARNTAVQLQAAVQSVHNQLSAQIKKEYEDAQAAADAANAPAPAPALDPKAEAEAAVLAAQRAEEAAASVAEAATEDHFPGLDGQTEG